VLPIRGRIIQEIERYDLEPLEGVGRTPEPDDYLLYPMERGAGRRTLAAYPKKKMGEPTIHRWWYQRLQEAGLVGEGATSGMNMHRARHSFAVDLRSVADLVSRSTHSVTHTPRPLRPPTGTTTWVILNAVQRLSGARSAKSPSTEIVSIDRPRERLS